MNNGKISVLGISGSLRPGSSASAVLKEAGSLLSPGIDFIIYEDLRMIPPFNDSDELPSPVQEFIKKVSESDAVIFCIPEYAFGVPGALKNALDWTVSSIAFSFKPVALITAASGGEKAHQAFYLTLTALGTKISAQTALLISFIRTKLDENKKITDPATREGLQLVINNLISEINRQ